MLFHLILWTTQSGGYIVISLCIWVKSGKGVCVIRVRVDNSNWSELSFPPSKPGSLVHYTGQSWRVRDKSLWGRDGLSGGRSTYSRASHNLGAKWTFLAIRDSRLFSLNFPADGSRVSGGRGSSSFEDRRHLGWELTEVRGWVWLGLKVHVGPSRSQLATVPQ